jgi:protein involved in polysaccharide export with SLBB domain
MKKNKAILLSAAAAVLIVVVVALVEVRSHAQSPTTQSTAPSVSPPTQPAMPGEFQNSLDAQGRGRYLVGPGDILDVRVFGQPDLNSTVEIDDEGNISSLPFLEEPIPAMCRNEKAIQKSIAKAYSRYIKNPRVSVLVKERRSRPPAVVFGAVRAPTRIQMMRRVRLHELLVAAGGVTLSASGKIQVVHTEREMCPQDSIPTPDVAEALTGNTLSASTYEKTSSITKPETPTVTPVSGAAQQSASSFTGEKSSKPIQSPANAGTTVTTSADNQSMQTLSDIGKIETYEIDTVRNGVGSTDPYIRPGDIVIVTEGEPIYVTGFLNAPREIVMKDNMTLSRAIYMAGGIQKTAKSHEVYIYRQVKGKVGPDKLVFDFDAIKNGKAPDVPLQAYDIIDVRPQSAFSAGSLRDMLLGMARGTVGGVGTALPYRIIY